MQVAQEYKTSDTFSNYLHKPFKDLMDLTPAGKSRPVQLVLAFDEASNLIHNDGTQAKDMRYSSLKRVLRSLFDLPIWTVFLSTDSKIEQFIVPANLDGSARIVKGIFERVPPFIALDTNIEAKRRYREDPQEIKKPMKQFATIKHDNVWPPLIAVVH